jgi:lipopolysaccharide transport system ATP-binding protein
MSSETPGDASGEPVIRVDHAGKTYRLYRRPADRLWQFLWPGPKPWFQDFTALEDVSFELRRGEVLGIVGVNGAGKSTLLQLVTGTVTPSHGTVQTNGRVAAILELGSGFNPEFTGRENIYLNAATLGLTRAEIDSRIDSIIEFAGIGLHIDQPVKTYSSGMLVRLAFSIASSVDPDVLIIDEALSVGDGAFRRHSFDRIMQIKERGTTILFCSHVLFHVEAFCDRALWLHRGKVQKIGKVADVLRPYQEFIDAYADDVNAEPFAAHGGHGLHPSVVDDSFADSDPTAAGPRKDARIHAIRVRLDSQLGTELHGIALESELEVEIEFVSDPELPTPTAALVLSSDSGKILGSCLSLTQGVKFARSPDGSGVARVRIERIPLNKGRYRVGAYLFCERGLHGYGMADPAAHITLHHVGAEQGAFLLKGAWDNGRPDNGLAAQ